MDEALEWQVTGMRIAIQGRSDDVAETHGNFGLWAGRSAAA